MADLPSFVRINEEGPREGFQIESADIPTHRKVELIDSLSGTGLKQIQLVSFVNPKRVPGMADASAVVDAITPREGVRYTSLWLNEQGFQRARNHAQLSLTGRIVLCASAAFLARNQGSTPEQNIEQHRAMIASYKQAGVPVEHGGLQAAFGCNFEGDIPVSRVLSAAQDVFAIAEEAGETLKTFVLADTMAWATPQSVERVVGEVRNRYPDIDIILHLHDTRGLGVANAYAGLRMGVRNFDAAVGGLGGCPFAGHQGAAGNVCTEDLVFMCHEMGIETGIDLDALIESARLAEDIVGHPLPGSVMKGGALDRFRQAAAANRTSGTAYAAGGAH